jgi:guanylate kinase
VSDATGSVPTFPVVLAAPSGTGKTTLAHALVRRSRGYCFSVSATTRAPRAGERDGVDYVFVDRKAFDAMVARGELAEWAEVHDDLYGTPRRELERAAERGEHVVLDIDVQGAMLIRTAVPDAVLIFVLPPSVHVLLERLTGRGTEEKTQVARRLRSALDELNAAPEFDYVVINDDLDRCLDEIRGIVRAESLRARRTALLEPRVHRIRGEIARVLDEEYANSPG